MSRFIRRDSASEDEDVQEAEDAGSERISEAITLFLEPEGDGDTLEGLASESSPGKSDDVPAITNYEELGQTIANLLKAAETEATRVIDEARAEAKAIRETAESEVKSRRAEADRYAKERRRDADAEAKKSREEGEATKRRLEEEGRSRRQRLARASRLHHEHLQMAITTYKGVVAQLEELLAEQPELDDKLLREVQDVTEVVDRSGGSSSSSAAQRET